MGSPERCLNVELLIGVKRYKDALCILKAIKTGEVHSRIFSMLEASLENAAFDKPGGAELAAFLIKNGDFVASQHLINAIIKQSGRGGVQPRRVVQTCVKGRARHHSDAEKAPTFYAR